MIQEPKTLLIDFETTANKGDFWGDKWQTSIIEITEYTKILSFSAKWLGGNQITKGWIHYPKYVAGKDNEERMLREIWDMFNEADILIAHNGKDFDFKVANSRFAAHNITPPSPSKVIDTKTEAKKYLRLPSYSLNEIAQYFGLGHKLEHEGYPLWKSCQAGDKNAWRKMLAYNKQDVVLLEGVYMRLLPYMKTPNAGMYTDKVICPRPGCGGTKFQSRGKVKNLTTEYTRLFCTKCGGWTRDNVNLREVKPMVAI